jgi:uncharacterized repeat protein (TIGR01451 family)
VTWTCVGSGGATCPAGGSGDIAAMVDLPVGGSATFSAACNTDASLAGGTLISNTATVEAPAGVTDTEPANDSATDTTTVTAVATGASVSGSKSVSGSFVAGGSVVYSIVLANAGGVQGDNPGDEFTDTLPAQLALVSASATSGAVVADTGTNTVTWNGAIAAAGSVTITIQAQILADASGNVSNQGAFAFDADANGSNESAGATDDPATGGASDPTVFAIGGGGGGDPVLPVPALGPVGLALLAFGMLLMVLRRRRHA